MKKQTKKAMPRGFVLYNGPSVLDGSPIVVVATLKTSNRKTGDMVQTWIIRSDMPPVDASKIGADSSVCGSCPQRHYLGGACYVNIGQAPQSVYKAFKRGAYPAWNAEKYANILAGRTIRAGAYGDPAAMPVKVYADFIASSGARHGTGYTHQLRHKNFQLYWLKFVMVSADTPRQAMAAHRLGARTFRVKTAESDFIDGEIECKADSEGISCLDCGLCDGKSSAPSIAINVHGSRSKRYADKYASANIISTIEVAA